MKLLYTGPVARKNHKDHHSAFSGIDTREHILEFTAGEGKTDTEIYQWLYTHQPLKAATGYASAVEAVGERTLLSGLVSAGKLKESGDKYVAV